MTKRTLMALVPLCAAAAMAIGQTSCKGTVKLADAASTADGGDGAPAASLIDQHCPQLLAADTATADALTGKAATDAGAPPIVLAAFERLSDPDARARVDAADLAVHDFAMTTGGVPSPHGPRALAVLVCDVSNDLAGAVGHVAALGVVHAAIGPANDADTISLAQQLVPHGIFLLGTRAMTPALTSIDDDGLVFRIAPSLLVAARSFDALAAVEEARVRSDLALGGSGKVKMTLLREATGDDAALANKFFSALFLNGAPASASPAELQQIDLSGGAPAAAASEVVAFAPHVVVALSSKSESGQTVAAIESAWPSGSAYRPRYLVTPAVVASSEVAAIPDASTRIAGLALSETNAETYPAFATRFAAAYPEVSGAASTYAQYFYDAVYALGEAYAAALPAADPSGTGVAKAFGRLVAGALSTDTPPDLASALQTLDTGGSVALRGQTNRFDWDLTTGDVKPTSVDHLVLCFSGSPSTFGPSPATVDPTSNTVIGSAPCL